MPIEVMAARGVDTLRYGPMKPVGLDDPRTGRWPYAVVQLRQDNALGTLWNMVGFQTKLKHGEQVRLFRTIPGLENAEFARLGGLHRNTFINSPELLDRELRLKAMPHIRFAGQITGCEGYVESAAIGLLAGRFAAAELQRRSARPAPAETALGALLGHITGGADAETYQPMNVNFGLLPPIEGRTKKADRKKLYTDRARAALAMAGSDATRVGMPSKRREPRSAAVPPSNLLRSGRRYSAATGRLLARLRRGRRIFRRGQPLALVGVGALRTCRSSCTAHSSKLSLPSPLMSSLANALRRGSISSSSVIRPSSSLSARAKRFSSLLLASASGAGRDRRQGTSDRGGGESRRRRGRHRRFLGAALPDAGTHR